MSHLIYLIFRCDFDVMENLNFMGSFWDLNKPESAKACSAGWASGRGEETKALFGCARNLAHTLPEKRISHA